MSDLLKQSRNGEIDRALFRLRTGMSTLSGSSCNDNVRGE